jgi:hypothetical protein
MHVDEAPAHLDRLTCAISLLPASGTGPAGIGGGGQQWVSIGSGG